ncbi:HET-domain-containing protein [Xylaria cf. heliscus]|nr:HET-domain-containing protein [Xylaria cf. heliscus]
MRLIDVDTLELKEFFHNLPPYAILSHTWGGDEVTFQEYLIATGPDAKRHTHITRKAGFPKIVGACRRAQVDGLQYLWCDTNCIDKTSSAELSEAINSMYAWYRDSVVCYAYLEDVDLGVRVHVGQGSRANLGPFENSRWFTRGWTLQELLAPKRVVFFDRMWKVLGDRKNLADGISGITRIHIGALHNRNTVSGYSIAQRMSWAADRQTSRQEDIAYCLLGIFGINMPLLYGEGRSAFRRFQEKLVTVSDDQSLLAWGCQGSLQNPWTGFLAPSPNEFRNCGSIVGALDFGRAAYSVTNLGIALNLPLIQTGANSVILAGLNCAYELRSIIYHDSERVEDNFTRRRFRIWIPICRVWEDQYQRGHLPASRVFLESSYSLLIRPPVKNIFLCAESQHIPQHIYHFGSDKNSDLAAQRIFELGSNPLKSPFGALVIVGAGVINPRTRSYTRVCNLSRFCILTLKPRGNDTLSHGLISNEGVSILLSIAWNKRGCATSTEYTSYADPSFSTTRHIASEQEWACLFGRSHLARQNNSSEQLYMLHTRLREVYSQSVSAVKVQGAPSVFVETDDVYDHHGRNEVIVDVIFDTDRL